MNQHTHCPFPKHLGDRWENIAAEDPGYIAWLLTDERSPVKQGGELWDTLEDVSLDAGIDV